MAKSLQDLQEKKVALQAQLERVEKEIAQAGFIDSLVAGAYVYGKLPDGTEFKNARLLGATKADGTAGVWYKLRVNENTAEESVKSVRLSNIDGVEGAAVAEPAKAEAPAKAETAAATSSGGQGNKGKKELSADDI